MRSRVPKVRKRVRDSPCSHCYESYNRTKLHNCDIYAEGLGQSHAGAPVVDSVPVSSYEPRLADSVSFLVVSLDPVASTVWKSKFLMLHI